MIWKNSFTGATPETRAAERKGLGVAARTAGEDQRSSAESLLHGGKMIYLESRAIGGISGECDFALPSGTIKAYLIRENDPKWLERIARE